MSAFLTDYYDLGLRALNAARLGLQVSGNNIANASVPGFNKRRLELTSGAAVDVTHGYLNRGVEVSSIGRPSDRLLQASLEREKGTFAGSQEKLRGLREIESLFGQVDDNRVLGAYTRFSNAFSNLSGRAESIPDREAAVFAADQLATEIRDLAQRLEQQQRSENSAVTGEVDEINRLASTLAQINRDIVGAEAGGVVSGPLRDQQEQIVEKLSELTGGNAYAGENGRVLFSLSGGPTLVTGDSSVPLVASQDASGLIRLSSGGVDVTDRLREGQLGAILAIRDDEIAGQLEGLDALATDLILRTNALTTASTNLQGNGGGPLFRPPSPGPGVATKITVSAGIRNDPSLLGISATGEPGDGGSALEISKIFESASASLDGKTPATFLSDLITGIGNAVVQTDVTAEVSAGLLDNLEARKESVSGVSLDEEAVQLIRYQQSYEAAARFMQVVNEITEITLSIGGR